MATPHSQNTHNQSVHQIIMRCGSRQWTARRSCLLILLSMMDTHKQATAWEAWRQHQQQSNKLSNSNGYRASQAVQCLCSYCSYWIPYSSYTWKTNECSVKGCAVPLQGAGWKMGVSRVICSYSATAVASDTCNAVDGYRHYTWQQKEYPKRVVSKMSWMTCYKQTSIVKESVGATSQ